MLTSEQLHDIVKSALTVVELDNNPVELYQPITYTLNLGGKRIRPVMVLMACEMFGGNVQTAINPAVAIEIFHNFTLLHDDIMDNASIRRGKPTVFKKMEHQCCYLIRRHHVCHCILASCKIREQGSS